MENKELKTPILNELSDDALEMAAGGAQVKITIITKMYKLQCPDCGTVIESPVKNLACPDCGRLPTWIVVG